jgi:hypothetical protein
MKNREVRFVILLTDEERAVIEELAKREHLAASTYARRLLLKDAIEKGFFDDEPKEQNDKRKGWLFGGK